LNNLIKLKIMPDNNKDEKNQHQSKDENQSKEENQNKVPEIELPDFRLCVQDNIPYNGIVKDLWKIKYDPNATILLRGSDADEPTEEDFDWLAASLNFGGILFGGFSTILANTSFSKQWNPWGWTDAKGNYRSVSTIKRNFFTQKYPGRGVQGLRNSNAMAKSKAILRLAPASAITRSISNAVGGISIALSCRDIFKSQIDRDFVKRDGAFFDLCFGCIAFVSGVGFVVSGVYFVTDVIVKETTGKRIHEHVDTWLSDKWYIIESNIQAAFWRLVNNCMPY
jgi:hypothetical protein